MKIYIPNNFLPERKYIISLLLGYLGIKPDFVYHKQNFYLIENKGKQIIFYDYFFISKDEQSGYLSEKYLPQIVKFLYPTKFYPEKLPFLYGEPYISQENERITVHADIFASAFYMLTRWEEAVIKQRDRHNRFPDELNFLKKNNLHYRPVVCEYIFLLRNLLTFLDLNLSLNPKYEVILTHDVDIFERYDTFINFAKATVNDIRLRHNIKKAIKGTIDYAKKTLGKGKDPYDRFDYLMDVSERYNLKSRFYFIPSLRSEPWSFYNYNNPKVVSTVKHILQRGHIVGLHGAYRGYNEPDIFSTELDRFRKAYGIIPTEGRQHFLRFENPTTWQLWEQNGLHTDSTLGFSTDIGFRTGMCYPYKVFDIIHRRPMNLIELPLIVMDGGIARILEKPEQILDKISEIKHIIKKFNGTFVLLWHPNSFVLPPFDKLGIYYEKMVKILTK